MRLTWDAYIFNLPTEHASFFLRRAYSLFTTNMIALVEDFTSMKTVAVQTALRISPSSQQHCSKVSWMHHYAWTVKFGSVLIIMGVMAITAIIIVAEVKKAGEATQFNNKLIHCAFCLFSKKQSCISIVQVFIVVPSLRTKYIAHFCTRHCLYFLRFKFSTPCISYDVRIRKDAY